MKRLSFPVFVLIVLLVLTPAAVSDELSTAAEPVILRFQHQTGEVLHADAVVRESVYINGIFSHEALISESSVTRTVEVNDSGTAVLESAFRTEERIGSLPGYLKWISSENVRLERDTRGRMDVPPDAARPVLRDIPVFPAESLSPGDTWSADAREVHIFRIGGVLAGPYRGEVPVAYKYTGIIPVDGRPMAQIHINYNLYVPVSGSREPVRLVSGRSKQVLLWNIESGMPHSKTEDFEFLMMMSNGSLQEFRGTQEVYYRRDMVLDRKNETAKFRAALEGLPGIDVSPSDTGIRLTIIDGGEVLFNPESADISTDQRIRLESLRPLLDDYPERDILITGHTAHFGTAEGRNSLSAERAAAVAGILFPDGRPGPGKLYLRGAGSDEPAAVEDGREGSARNRRVEILVID